MTPKKKRVDAKPKFRTRFSDGSGDGEDVITEVDGKERAIAVTGWGCSCCKGPVTDEERKRAQDICDALNAAYPAKKGKP